MINVPEGFTWRKRVEACSFRIQCIGINGVTPPYHDVVRTNIAIQWVLKAEEDENDRHRNSSIECSGQNICVEHKPNSQKPERYQEKDSRLTVVFCPPGEVTPADDEVEDETNDRPRNVVGRVCGRDGTETAEHYGEVDVFDD